MDQLAALAADPALWVALVTLIALEVVLGVDNLIFISILTNKLPEAMRPRARRFGLGGALVLRLALLMLIPLIVRLTEPLFEVFGQGISGKDLVLIAGGLFLVWKATKEIHHNVDPADEEDVFTPRVGVSFAAAVGQIMLLNMVFSIDSIVTAIGMTDNVAVMAIAVVVSVAVMAAASAPLARFVEVNPTVIMLALAFLMLIGTTLIADGFGAHVPKGYIYAAMAFSTLVETLNIVSRRNKAKARAARDAIPAASRRA